MTTNPASDTASRGPSHASVFVWLFAVSAIWHYTSSASEIVNYWITYNAVVTPLIFLSIVTAFIAACYPTRTAALMTMCVGQLISIVLRFPFVADHLVMELFLNLSILGAYLSVAARNRTIRVSLDEIFALFGPVGRWLLIIMYFFGTFHKLNPGFMSVASSCAVPFIEGFPFLEPSPEWVAYAAIWGTLIFESIAMVLLLNGRTKYFGMLLGMSFHLVVGISGFGTLAHFSAFALALHTLFLPSGFGKRMFVEPRIPAILKNAVNFRIATVILIALQIALGLHMVHSREGFLVNALFAAFAVSLIFLVIRYGRMQKADAPYRLKSPVLALNILPVWFFIHCASPYIGLGTGGTMAMFSGLRTEGGISNHYLIREPVPLYSYQEPVIYFESATNPSLQRLAREGQAMVMFDFQRHITLRDQLALPLTVIVDEQRYVLDTVDSFQSFANEYFAPQSLLERKYMSFRIVDDPRPLRCRH